MTRCTIILLVCLAATHGLTSATSNTTKIENLENLNKTKRGVIGETQIYESLKPTSLYPDSSAAPASQSAVPSLTPNPLLTPPPPLGVFESDVPKQVTAQQVLYEYQQTPNAAVSNVHVNQHFQPLPTAEAAPSHNVYSSQFPPGVSGAPLQFGNLEAQPNQFVANTENFVSPIQHSTLVKHAQNYGNVQYPANLVPRSHQHVSVNRLPQQQFPYQLQQHPQQFYNGHLQPQPQITNNNPFAPQGKYIYANGKIVYYPQPNAPGIHNPSSHHHHHQQQYPAAQGVKQQAHSFSNQFRPSPQYKEDEKKFVPITTSNPLRYNYFNQGPPKTAHKQPYSIPIKEAPKEQEEEEEEKASLEEEAEDEEEESDGRPSHYEEEEEEEDEDEHPKKYYRYYEESDDDEEEAEDAEREPSKKEVVKTKQPRKYYSEDSYLEPSETKEYKKEKERLKKKEKEQLSEGSEDIFEVYPKKKPYNRKFVPKYSSLYALFNKSKPKTTTPKPTPKPKPKSRFSSRLEPNTEYTIYKISKVLDPPVKGEVIEGRQSENVPVIHTQKVYKKEWLVTKTDDDNQ